MKALAKVLVVVGIIGMAWAIIGRFLVGDVTVMGFLVSGGIKASNLLTAANSAILLAVLCKLCAK